MIEHALKPPAEVAAKLAEQPLADPEASADLGLGEPGAISVKAAPHRMLYPEQDSFELLAVEDRQKVARHG